MIEPLTSPEEEGPTGAPGPTGPAGATGPEGPTGPPGAAGASGSTGPTGATGPEGFPGANYSYLVLNQITGATGATGPQGDIGLMGATGPEGATGPVGGSGATGPSGEPGLPGATGPDGSPGRQGATGATGPSGGSQFGPISPLEFGPVYVAPVDGFVFGFVGSSSAPRVNAVGVVNDEYVMRITENTDPVYVLEWSFSFPVRKGDRYSVSVTGFFPSRTRLFYRPASQSAISPESAERTPEEEEALRANGGILQHTPEGTS